MVIKGLYFKVTVRLQISADYDKSLIRLGQFLPKTECNLDKNVVVIIITLLSQ